MEKWFVFVCCFEVEWNKVCYLVIVKDYVGSLVKFFDGFNNVFVEKDYVVGVVFEWLVVSICKDVFVFEEVFVV